MGLCCWFGSCLFLCFCYKGIWIIWLGGEVLCSFHTWLLQCWDSGCLVSKQQILRKWSPNKYLSYKSVKFGVFAYSLLSHAEDSFPFKGEKPLLLLDFCKPLQWSNMEHKPWIRFVLLMGRTCAAPTACHPFSVLPLLLWAPMAFLCYIAEQVALTKWVENGPNKV